MPEKEIRKPREKKVSKELEEISAFLKKFVEDLNPTRLEILSDIVESGVKLAKDSPGTLNLKITSATLRELRYSFRMFGPHRSKPKITMFGSARVKEGTPLYEFARDFAADAKSKGYMIITGGGPGIMQAGNEGAKGETFGLNIRLPFEQSPNPYIDAKNGLINYKYFFTRKLFLVKEARAFAFFPGGFGTFDEAFEALTLMQTGKTSIVPIVLLEPKGFDFWKPLYQFVEDCFEKKGFISENDKALYRIFNSGEEALNHIEEFYKVYHSMRFVRELVVIRLKEKLSEKSLKEIEKKFPKLSTSGKFELLPPLEEESNEPEIAELPRLVFPCDRKDFGTLRRLIDFINAAN